MTSSYLLTSIVLLLLSAYLHYRYSKLQTSDMSSNDALSEELKNNPIDPNSFSRPDVSRVIHIQWNASVNFDQQIIEGSVELTVDKLNDKTDELILDTSDLTINQIKDKETDQILKFELSPTIKTFGSKLTVKLLAKKRSIVSISYKTSPKASALQWLKSEQTAGKRQPYLFSQCQAIHCRSLVPCQDTPAVKATYSATITVPKDLVVLLSAIREGKGALSGNGLTKDYSFKQVVPIPSYLIAIVVGDLVSKQIGPRTHVWSEPELIERSAYEFAETEKMLTTAEDIVGPYVWGIYDLLILPPSFPYGGMENPCLTFVTPTLLAGDRSLANVVAHEIAHSWTGNLVTNQNWGHFWLNEGFTMFLERKIEGRLSGGEPYRQFQAIEGLSALKFDIESLGSDSPFTKLLIDPRGVDPDEAFSRVPYEKGHTFLFFLEQKLGGPQVFDPFLRAYIDKNKFTSIITKDFKEFLYEFFKDKKNILETIDWNLWLNGTGMPPVIPDYDKSLSEKCTALAKRWVSAQESDLSQFNARDISSMDSWQTIVFLNQLIDAIPDISQSKVESITQIYGLKSNNNCEIKLLWLRLGLKAHWKPCVEDAIHFITSQGRMKFLKPIYRALYAWDETRQLAIDTFKGHCHEMMHMSAVLVARELHLQL